MVTAPAPLTRLADARHPLPQAARVERVASPLARASGRGRGPLRKQREGEGAPPAAQSQLRPVCCRIASICCRLRQLHPPRVGERQAEQAAGLLAVAGCVASEKRYRQVPPADDEVAPAQPLVDRQLLLAADTQRLVEIAARCSTSAIFPIVTAFARTSPSRS